MSEHEDEVQVAIESMLSNSTMSVGHEQIGAS